MSIVLNEYDWAEKMIANHDLGKKPIETLSRVSKYYYEKSLQQEGDSESTRLLHAAV